MDIMGMIVITILTGLCAALYVAFRYEKKQRVTIVGRMDAVEDECHNLRIDNAELRMRIAKDEGVAVGRQCDAIQQKMIKDLSAGKGVSIRSDA